MIFPTLAPILALTLTLIVLTLSLTLTLILTLPPQELLSFWTDIVHTMKFPKGTPQSVKDEVLLGLGFGLGLAYQNLCAVLRTTPQPKTVRQIRVRVRLEDHFLTLQSIF